MREDMAKVLVERPRRGGGVKFPRGAKCAPIEEMPRRESAKRVHQHHRKYLNENLAPLRRFLLNNVGRPWNSVYSEICERINRNSAVQLHIWQHLMWEVERDPVKIAKHKAYGYVSWRGQLYVDARTGLLGIMTSPTRCKRRAGAAPREPQIIYLDGGAFKRIDGIWYAIEFEPLENLNVEVWDALLSRVNPKHPQLVNGRELKAAYGRPVRAARKRQLNSKEIRRLDERLAK